MSQQPLVLPLDDGGYVRHVFRQQLQASGYRVHEVECGERAIEMIRTFHPDLVILDVMMEGMNELEVCAQLKVKVAMVTKVERDSLKSAAKRLETEIQRLHFEALVDPLTGLTNRRGFLVDGYRVLREARVSNHPVALWLVDVDYFKRVNDTWGHVVGDEMLKRVSRQLRKDLEMQHICARIGGKELLAVSDQRLCAAKQAGRNCVRCAVQSYS